MAQTVKKLLAGAHYDVVGIGIELDVYTGYDSKAMSAWAGEKPAWVRDEAWKETLMPKAERIKLADIMIARWQAYRAAVENEAQDGE